MQIHNALITSKLDPFVLLKISTTGPWEFPKTLGYAKAGIRTALCRKRKLTIIQAFSL
jgi:hypothetical protein